VTPLQMGHKFQCFGFRSPDLINPAGDLYPHRFNPASEVH
jgi:hypothetical protein